METDREPEIEEETLGRRFVEAAWADGDFEEVTTLSAPGLVVHDSKTPTAVTGPDRYEHYVRRHRDAVPDLELRVGDTMVADHGQWSARPPPGPRPEQLQDGE